ncbi:hypothetical protein SAMN05192573_13113 [Mucilaginibacter gossypii]|uniref:Uncharacterized protein n=1 Tax=Mucilaginibacter gossypii TaxID=551996 RepID=A0A1G8N4L8_9SPHI|nr:hypothetical protein SAMN05192573_13113 [Mucilaginibacter gossypii]
MTGIKNSDNNIMILKEVIEMAKHKLAPLMNEISKEDGTVSVYIYTRIASRNHCSEALIRKINSTFSI